MEAHSHAIRRVVPILLLALTTTLAPALASSAAAQPILGPLNQGGVVCPAVANANLTASDFNGDDYPDLAIGAPLEDLNEGADAGAVNVIYGGNQGLTDAGNQGLHQSKAGVEGTPVAGDHFGQALAIGNFNNDNYADLAVGIPNKDVGVFVDTGTVQIFYGSSAGLSTANDAIWSQTSFGPSNGNETGDNFGGALTAGYFNNDPYADLAIGAPTEDVDVFVDAGGIYVLYGSATGLRATNSQAWSQIIGSIIDDPDPDDRFGSALAAGDFNADACDDLAIGIPGENDVGYVSILYAAAAGLTSNDQIWGQDTQNIDGVAEPGDEFGASLAAGDFDADGRDDLAIGVPGENLNTGADGGAVNVLYGSGTGLGSAGNYSWHLAKSGVVGDPAEGDHYGADVAAGDFNGDDYDDLAVGIPERNVSAGITNVDAGSIHILYGSGARLTATGDILIHQPEIVEPGDNFGAAVFAADFDLNGSADLVVGAPGETGSVPQIPDAGTVSVLYGPINGQPASVQNWHQGTGTIDGEVESEDFFGSALP